MKISLLTLFLGAVAPALSGATLTFSPLNTEVVPGGGFEFVIQLSGVTDPMMVQDNVGAFQILGEASQSGVVFGLVDLNSSFVTGGGTNSVGAESFQISAIAVSVPVVGPIVEIGRVSGTVSSAALNGTMFSVQPIFPSTFFADGTTFTPITIDSFEGASFNVVPEPTALSLLLCGLGLLVRRSRE